MSPSPRIPSYRKHRASGLAVVTIASRDYYLGEHGSKKSRAEYERLIGEWLASGRATPPAGPKARTGQSGTTVDDLTAAHWRYHEAKGTDAKTLERMRLAFRPLHALYGATLASEFRPRALKALRVRFVEAGLSRWTTNERTWRVKNLFRWGTAEELVPPAVYQVLAAVTNLRRGEDGVRDDRVVGPVAWEHVESVLPHVSPQVRAIVTLLWNTGARVGEIVSMRAMDIDRSKPGWVYRPATHKTAHHGKTRAIPLGPKSREVLGKFLDCAPPPAAEQPLFTYRRPMRPGQRNRSPLRPYDIGSVRRAIQRGIDRVNTPRIRKAVVQAAIDLLTPPQASAFRRHIERVSAGRLAEDVREDLLTAIADRLRLQDPAVTRRLVATATKAASAVELIPDWHPHQVRHSMGTRVRHEEGLDAARAVLGHSSARVTEVYAEIDRERAQAVVERVG